MRPHAPKTAALTAFDAGALSSAGRARVVSHLAVCEGCRSELAAIRLWSRESARMRALRTAPVRFAAMEQVLAREAERQGQRAAAERATRTIAPFLAPLALAASVLVTLALERAMGDAAPVRSAAPSRAERAAPAEVLAAVPAEVTLRAGDVRARGSDTLLDVGTQLDAPAVVQVREGSLRLSLGAEVALGLGPEGLVGLVRSDANRAELELLRGGLDVGVEAGFESAERVVVLAAGYAVAAEVATFRVELPLEGPAPIEVVVQSGTVRVTGRGESLEIVGPSRVAPPGLPRPIEPEVASRLAGGLGPRGGVEGGARAPVRVERPGVVRWHLPDGSEVVGASLAFLAPLGPLRLVGLDGFGQPTEVAVTVGASGLVAEGAPLAPAGPRLSGYLAPELLAGVIDRARLTRCYNQALRLRPDLGPAQFRLRVSLSARGEVLRTRLEGAEVPPSLEACVAEETARWAFPAPGGPMSFVVPLSFSAVSGAARPGR
jgi:hypothetical protein